MKHLHTFEEFLNEAEKFKSTKDFEDFLEEIDGMDERSIKLKMGKDYIDTPGSYRDEADDYDNDITEYMIANMGRKEFEKLKAYWETNIKESAANEDSAGTFELEKDWTGKDIRGKKVTLKKGTELTHERSGGFGQDYMNAGSITINAEDIDQSYLSAPY